MELSIQHTVVQYGDGLRSTGEAERLSANYADTIWNYGLYGVYGALENGTPISTRLTGTCCGTNRASRDRAPAAATATLVASTRRRAHRRGGRESSSSARASPAAARAARATPTDWRPRSCSPAAHTTHVAELTDNLIFSMK